MTPADERRLQRYDAFVRGVREDLAKVEQQMKGLREANRGSGATYRQLLSNRMILQEILDRLERAGL